MPVKKITTDKKNTAKTDRPKSTPKNAGKKQIKKINSTIKKDIKEAVEQIPKLVMKERIDNAGKEKKYQNKKHLLFWIGIVSLTSAVFIMWFANIRLMFGGINKKITKSEEMGIVNESAADLRKIIDVVKVKNEEAKKNASWNESALAAAASNLDLIIKNISEMTSITTDTVSTTANTTSSIEKIF